MPSELQTAQMVSAIRQLIAKRERDARVPTPSDAILTCVNHPDLRWRCKAIAWTAGNPGHYNGARNIFFFGRWAPEEDTTGGLDPYSMFSPDRKHNIHECDCPASDLRLDHYEY